MGCQKVFSDRRVFMFNKTLVEVSSCKADIIWITQITCKRVNNALFTLVYSSRVKMERSLAHSWSKDCLLKTMIHHAYALSSTTEAFDQECTRLCSIFTRLDYPLVMINSIITKTIQSLSFGTREKNKEDSSIVRVILPFKDQTSANAVRRQMHDLSHKIGTTLQPVFTSRKLEQDLKPREIKPPIIVDLQSIVYSFTCDLCDSDYVGFTARHLHQRLVEHKYSAIGKHFSTAHGDTSLLKESQFRILKKCQGKLDCLVYEMLFIKERNPSLNTQTDSIRAKLVV